MASFLALYQGETVGSATLVAVSADPDIVSRFADELLRSADRAPRNPAAGALDEGRRRALRLIREEAEVRAGAECTDE